MVQWYLVWSQLKRLDLDDSDLFLSRKQMYIGSQAKKLLKDQESGSGKVLWNGLKQPTLHVQKFFKISYRSI